MVYGHGFLRENLPLGMAICSGHSTTQAMFALLLSVTFLSSSSLRIPASSYQCDCQTYVKAYL
jgi:hypothetical protein